MRWSWPSWVAIVSGLAFLAAGFVILFTARYGEATAVMILVGSLLLVGGMLLASGLHGLQASMDAWCDCPDCRGVTCSCNHCEDCVDGECCGDCACADDHGGGKAYVHMPTP